MNPARPTETGRPASAQAGRAPSANDAPASHAATQPDDAACSGAESFALRVLGDAMEPEFSDGEIIIVEPGGALVDGCFVLAFTQGEWTFRQLCRRGEAWALHALNPERTDLPDQPLADLAAVRGRIIQKAVPGRRRLAKRYV